jgi:sugar/nucleoside kinase (ribokinase family)
MLDSMNLWITTALDDLLSVMKRVDLIIINDGEVKMIANDDNFIRASRKVVEITGCNTLIVKRGEFGVIAFHGEEIVSLPAYPTDMVIDPTGCGDSFAGTLASYFATGEGELSRTELRDALIAATVTSSFTLESFGTERLINLQPEEFQQRLESYKKILS